MAEWCGYRWHVILGDLSKAESFTQEFCIALRIDQDLFEYAQYNDDRNYALCWWQDVTYWTSHTLTLCAWRWGLYVSLRGRKTPSLTSPD